MIWGCFSSFGTGKNYNFKIRMNDEMYYEQNSCKKFLISENLKLVKKWRVEYDNAMA